MYIYKKNGKSYDSFERVTREPTRSDKRKRRAYNFLVALFCEPRNFSSASSTFQHFWCNAKNCAVIATTRELHHPAIRQIPTRCCISVSCDIFVHCIIARLSIDLTIDPVDYCDTEQRRGS